MGRNNKKHQSSPGKNKKKESSGSDINSSTNEQRATVNRPKNHLITDATKPYTFSFSRFGSSTLITVKQTPDENVWPGGALWDLGVLLAQVLVMLTRGASVISPGGHANTKQISKSSTDCRRLQSVISPINWKDVRVLELGCGVGLTGLVAASLGAKLVLLTDLEEVTSSITAENVDLNAQNNGSKKASGYRTMAKSGGKVLAMPLCWGNTDNEENVAKTLELIAPTSVTNTSTRKRTNSNIKTEGNKNSTGIPEIIIIGDVAYQHKPGAPSHFDALLSTLLRFTNERTLVMFGTRMRMPASSDLLHMFREHMDELVTPPIEAHEIDPSFDESNELLKGKKHNMTIHFLKRKKAENIPPYHIVKEFYGKNR